MLLYSLITTVFFAFLTFLPSSSGLCATLDGEDNEARGISHLERSLASQEHHPNRQELWKIYDFSMGKRDT
jgi:hypothetical protein